MHVIYRLNKIKMHVIYRIIIVILISTVARCRHNGTTRVSKCIKHTGELPINTYIVGCSTPPCVLPQLHDIVAYVDFRAPRPIISMRTFATAYLSNRFITVPVPYSLGESAVTCNFISNARCPLAKGDELQYTFKMYLGSYFPVGTSATAEFRVVDQEGGPVICIRVPLKIASAETDKSIETRYSIKAPKMA